MPSTDIFRIKSDISQIVGSRVRLESFKGRQKIILVEGYVEKVYPSIFIVSPRNLGAGRTQSFSYADVLTKSVEIVLCE